jgi:two-component system LytT family response regulator
MSARLSVFVLDDEPLAVKRLVRLLTGTGRVDVVGSATDPEAGLTSLATQSVDVVFLDIRMPGLDGLEVARRIPADTMVVFTTAYDTYAVDAFEANAIDYLLKPIERERLARTLERVASRRGTRSADIGALLEQLTRRLAVPVYQERVASRVGERVQLVAVDEITHVVSRDRAVFAVTRTAEHLLGTTLADLERTLDPARFLRIHRGALVNVAFIGELHADFGGRLTLRLKA